MKWIVVAALALLLIIAAVVYLQHDRQLPVPPAPMATPAKVAPVHHLTSIPPAPVDITGPLKNRDLVRWVLPEYPEWAEAQGLTGTLRVKIWVTSAGQVKSFVQTEQVTSDHRLDEEAVKAVKQWQFVEKPNSFGDQWGVVSIHYSLLTKEADRPGASFKGVSLGKQTVSGLWECIRKWVGDSYVYICKLRHAKN